MQFKVGSSSSFIKKAVGTSTLLHPNQVSLKDLTSLGKPIVLLVDADIVAYRCSATADGRCYHIQGTDRRFAYKKDAVAYCAANGYDPKKDISCEYKPEDVQKVYNNIKSLVRTLGNELQSTRIEHYLTPDLLFRNEVRSDYKKNREGLRKPHHLAAAKELLTNKYNAEQVDGYEADDLLAIRARQLIEEGKYTPVICSLDKDLDTISAYHYQWTKKCLYFVTPEEGTLNFYQQVLTGDKVDNIPGLKNVGPVTAKKILKDCDGSSSYQCYLKVLDAYLDKTDKKKGETDEDFKKRVVQELTANARLLYILHKPGEVWYPPVKPKGEDEDAVEQQEAD